MKQIDPQNYLAHPLLLLAIAFAVGIVSFQNVGPSRFLLVVLASGVALSGLVCLGLLVKSQLPNACVFLCFAFFFTGGMLTTLERKGVAPHRLRVLLDSKTIAADETIELTGVLIRPPEPAPERFYLTLWAESIRAGGFAQRASGNVTLILPLTRASAAARYEKLDLHYGARITVQTALSRTPQFRNPGGSSFTEYLDRNELDATALVKSPLLIERLDDEHVFLPLAWLYEWRQQLQQQINANFSRETAGVLSAALIGARYFLSRNAAERFREGGTFHVLVISGLHISFIGGLVLLCARRIAKRRLTHFVLSAVVLWSYSIAVGAEASVVRAAIMFTLVAFAPVVSRRRSSLNGLATAALILLAWRPSDLFDPSFQLTFLSVLAIVVFAWPLLRRMAEIGSWRPTRATPYPPAVPESVLTLCEVLFWRDKKWQSEVAQLNYRYHLLKAPLAAKLEHYHLQVILRYAFAAVVTSLSVQITLLPLLILYFHRVSISSVILNIGVSLIMAALIFVSIAALLLSQLSASLATPLFSLANALNWLMVHGVDPFARLGVASFRLPSYSGGWFVLNVLFFIPLTLLALALTCWHPLQRSALRAKYLRRRKQLWLVAGLQIFLLAILVLHPFSSRETGKLEVNFLDVGQGDAALVTAPDGTTLLIDGGGRPQFARAGSSSDAPPAFERDTRTIGEAVVSEYLWWRGLDHVDYLLATHADADHMQGLNDVARNFGVRVAFVARTPARDVEFDEFAATLKWQEIPWQLIGAGDELQLGGVRARVLWPFPSEPPGKSGNNESLVLHLECGSRSLLLLGDIESEAESELVERAQESLGADVVKVAHHGSRTSSIANLVAASRPRFAVISVGQRSMFGHPHREVVERWRAAGAEVMTTGQHGTITVVTDGRNLEVSTFMPR